MKKFLALTLALVMVLCLMACAQTEETTADNYDCPDKTFGGHEFVFLNVEPQSWASMSMKACCEENDFIKSFPVPAGTAAISAFSKPTAPFTTSLRVPSPPQA